MKWAIEIQKTSLEQRNLADLLKGLGFDLIQGIEYPALSSRTIDACASASEAFEIAKNVRAAFMGPAKIDQEFVLGSVIDYTSTPPHRHAFLEVDPCVMMMTTCNATLTISPPQGTSPDELAKWHEEYNERQYQAELERQRVLLEPAFLDPKAAKVIELLCIENPSGETLFKIYELIEGHPKNRAVFHTELGIDKKQFDRFRDAVHNPAVTGDWARHAYYQKPNSPDPMTKGEAKQFVYQIANSWLQTFRQSK